MVTVPASLLCTHAKSLGLPAGKTNLLRLMRQRGVPEIRQRVAGGQHGIAYPLESLWPELQVGVEALLASVSEVSRAIDFATYAGAPPRSRSKADKSVRRMEAMRVEIAAGASVTAAAAKVAALPERGASPKTLTREWAKVRNLPLDQWHVALVPGYKPRKPAPMVEAAWLFFKTAYARRSKPSAQQCYEETRRAAVKNGWGVLPSVKTFMRRWTAMDAYVRSALRDGKDTADKTMTPRREIDRDDVHAMFLVSVDARIWDMLVEMPDGRVIRLVVAAAIDEGSGYGLHYEVGETENTALYRRLLVGVVRKHGPPKRGFLFDNTMAAANKDITGGVDIRHRFTRKYDEVNGLLKRCDIGVYFTTPGSPQSKLVERGFNDWKDRSEKASDAPDGGYTGNKPTAKPEGSGTTPVPYAKALELIERGWHQRNTEMGKRSKITGGRSYAETHAAKLEGVVVRRLTAEQERLFLAKAYHVTPTPDGKVRIGTGSQQIVYWHPALQAYGRGSERHGQKIAFLVDPDDFTKPGMAYTLDDELIEGNVERWGTTGFRNLEDQSNHTRRERQVKKASKAKVAAEALLSQAEMRAYASPVEPEAEHPKAAVVAMVPNGSAKVANDGAAPDTAAPPVRDPAKVAAWRRGMREELTATTGPDNERRKRGLEFLASKRAG